MNLATTTPRPTQLIALAGMALALALPAAWAQQQPAQPPKLSKSYYERVDELQDRVNEGKLAEVAGTIVPTTERKTFEVDGPAHTHFGVAKVLAGVPV